MLGSQARETLYGRLISTIATTSVNQLLPSPAEYRLPHAKAQSREEMQRSENMFVFECHDPSEGVGGDLRRYQWHDQSVLASGKTAKSSGFWGLWAQGLIRWGICKYPPQESKRSDDPGCRLKL